MHKHPSYAYAIHVVWYMVYGIWYTNPLCDIFQGDEEQMHKPPTLLLPDSDPNLSTLRNPNLHLGSRIPVYAMKFPDGCFAFMICFKSTVPVPTSALSSSLSLAYSRLLCAV
jgi:hypothetical protein